MKLIRRKPEKPIRGHPRNRAYVEKNLVLNNKELKQFRRWLIEFKGYSISIAPGSVFWYQETLNSPKITIKRDYPSNQRFIVHALGSHHIDEFKNKSYAVAKNCRDIGDFYRSYMASPDWKERSLKCFADASHQCEVCGNSDDLNAHHYNYHNLAKEGENDLFCLCKRCHGLYHRKYPASELPKDYDLPRLARLHHIMGTVLQMMKRV